MYSRLWLTWTKKPTGGICCRTCFQEWRNRERILLYQKKRRSPMWARWGQVDERRLFCLRLIIHEMKGRGGRRRGREVNEGGIFVDLSLRQLLFESANTWGLCFCLSLLFFSLFNCLDQFLNDSWMNDHCSSFMYSSLQRITTQETEDLVRFSLSSEFNQKGLWVHQCETQGRMQSFFAPAYRHGCQSETQQDASTNCAWKKNSGIFSNKASAYITGIWI